MKINKITIIATLIFALIQILILSHFIIREPETLSLKCASSFTRNMKEHHSTTYTGEMTLLLFKSGRGNISFEGITNESPPRIFQRAYFFDHYIDDEGNFRATIKSDSSGKNDDFPEDFFNKEFFDLDFRLRGGLRINKFKNVYILSTPGFIISTCAPV